jgi:DNA transformation protein and related proteins
MTESTTGKLYVSLSASQVRRRLKGHGLGVRRIESAGKGRAVIVHTATGKHLRQLEAFFQGAIETPSEDDRLGQPGEEAAGDQ